MKLLVYGEIIGIPNGCPDILVILFPTPALISVDVTTIVSAQNVGTKSDTKLVLLNPYFSDQQSDVVVVCDSTVFGYLLIKRSAKTVDTLPGFSDGQFFQGFGVDAIFSLAFKTEGIFRDTRFMQTINHMFEILFASIMCEPRTIPVQIVEGGIVSRIAFTSSKRPRWPNVIAR